MKVEFLRALSKESYFTEMLHLKIFKLFEILRYIVTPFFHIFFMGSYVTFVTCGYT
jgi:hypothetical protein